MCFTWKFGADVFPMLYRDLNRLIMDYLVIEGYKSAAEEFSQEANLTPPMDFESIESRMDIREALQRGDVEDAITRVNDLNPEVSCGVSSSWEERQGMERIKTFSCTTHRPFGVVDDTYQNFSLQHDPLSGRSFLSTSFFISLLLSYK